MPVCHLFHQLRTVREIRRTAGGIRSALEVKKCFQDIIYNVYNNRIKMGKQALNFININGEININLFYN